MMALGLVLILLGAGVFALSAYTVFTEFQYSMAESNPGWAASLELVPSVMFAAGLAALMASLPELSRVVFWIGIIGTLVAGGWRSVEKYRRLSKRQ